jgi:hypothetical protein
VIYVYDTHLAFRFGPRPKRPLLIARFFSHLAGDFGESKALPNYARNGKVKTIRIGALASIESKSSFVKVAEQVKRFDRNIRALSGSLQETPEVFNAVRVNPAARSRSHFI